MLILVWFGVRWPIATTGDVTGGDAMRGDATRGNATRGDGKRDDATSERDCVKGKGATRDEDTMRNLMGHWLTRVRPAGWWASGYQGK